MGFLKEQSGHDHSCFHSHTFEGRAVSVGSEHTRELSNESFPCFPRRNFKEVPSPMYDHFVAAVDGTSKCFTIHIPPSKVGC